MKPIRILIIDDQYARDSVLRTDLLGKTGMLETGNKRGLSSDIEAEFCSGQIDQGDEVRNDYDVIFKVVKQGYGDGADFVWGLVLLDVRFDSQPIQDGDDNFGVSVREWLRRDFPELPVVMFTGKHEAEIKDSQEHYLSKQGINACELKRALLDYGMLEMDQARELLGVGDDIVFASKEMLKVYRDAYVHAKNDQSILILGESGSGKEGLAKYIHGMSSRSKAPYVAFNMAEFSEGLIESTLFGIGSKVATNVQASKGLFEQANGGTLFFDEIGDMALPLQAKILRAIQEKVVRRLGSEKDVKVDVRFISATHSNLGDRIVSGAYRGDLFYRISGVTINVPPLRDRRADIAPLTNYFLTREMKDRDIQISESAMRKLEQYDFPGNVRELENLVTQLVSDTGHRRVIKADDIKLPVVKSADDLHSAQEGPHSESSSSTADADTTNTNPLPVPEQVNLSNLHEVIAAINIEKDNPALLGIKPRVESAIQTLMQRCAGAALAHCKKPMEEEYGLLLAMQLLAGSKELKGALMYRELDKIFGRPQKTASVNQDDLKALVEIWKRQGR